MSIKMKSYKDQNFKYRIKPAFALALLAALFAPNFAVAMPDNFFGANAKDAQNGNTAPDVDETTVNSALPGLTNATPALPPPGSYTDDEKRMQHKYKDNMNHAKGLISKGSEMMKSAGKDDKTYKRGKILKETGEKWLADLKANDPFGSGEKPVETAKKDSSSAAKATSTR